MGSLFKNFLPTLLNEGDFYHSTQIKTNSELSILSDINYFMRLNDEDFKYQDYEIKKKSTYSLADELKPQK